MPAEADAPVVAKKGKGAIYAAIGAVVVLALAGIGLMQKPAPAASESSAGAAAPSSAAAAATTPAVPETPAAATTSGKTSKASGAPAAKTAPPTKATGVVASTAKAADKPAADTAALSATVSFEILPYGDIYENNRKLGTSPPLRQLKVAPGKHKFEIRGDRKPFYAYHTVDVKAGETQKVWVKFDD
jgi:hypothetical protein